MKRVLFALVAAGTTALAACAFTPAASPPRSADAPDQVILLIADGAGTAYWTAARWSAGELAVQGMPVIGLVDTRSADSRITDSAAGATVYSAGVRTYNGAIGVGVACRARFAADSAAVMRDPASCDPLPGLFDLARERGWRTGLVATSSITHATPASFAAHVPYRRMQPEIAEQLARGDVHVMLGGGRGFFDGALRRDRRDLLAGLCAAARCIGTPEELAAYRPDGRPLVGLFAENQMPAAAERRPSLPEMTRVALETLRQGGRGFVLMVEGSQPDWRGHENATLPALTAEMVDFDRTVAVVLEFARQNPRTLVVVTADHETGGLSLAEDADTAKALYPTDYHTGEMVPLFAAGPGAERFGGIRDNAEVGRLLREAVHTR
jgi:alkaline phosphatase